MESFDYFLGVIIQIWAIKNVILVHYCFCFFIASSTVIRFEDLYMVVVCSEAIISNVESKDCHHLFYWYIFDYLTKSVWSLCTVYWDVGFIGKLFLRFEFKDLLTVSKSDDVSFVCNVVSFYTSKVGCFYHTNSYMLRDFIIELCFPLLTVKITKALLFLLFHLWIVCLMQCLAHLELIIRTTFRRIILVHNRCL